MFHVPAHKQTDAAKAPAQIEIINVRAAAPELVLEAAVEALRAAIRNRDDKTFNDACSRIAGQFNVGIGSLRNALTTDNEERNSREYIESVSFARRYAGVQS